MPDDMSETRRLCDELNEAMAIARAPSTYWRKEAERYKAALQEIVRNKSLAAPRLWRIAEDALSSGGPTEGQT